MKALTALTAALLATAGFPLAAAEAQTPRSLNLSREERALMDVYETVPILESEDCLHEFWQSPIDHQRIIKSFDLIGATSLVDPLNASRWCATRSDDRNDYSETEAEYLATIEEDLPAGMDELVDLVLEFIEEELG